MFSLFSKPLPVGSIAPQFLLPDEDGTVFVLNLNRNKNVVLIFYPGDETPVCRKQLCEVRDNWQRIIRFDEDGDDNACMDELVELFGTPFKNHCDKED